MLNFKPAKIGSTHIGSPLSPGLEFLRLILFFSQKNGKRFSLVSALRNSGCEVCVINFCTHLLSKYFSEKLGKSILSSNFNQYSITFLFLLLSTCGQIAQHVWLILNTFLKAAVTSETHLFSAHQFCNRDINTVPKALLLGLQAICHSCGWLTLPVSPRL